MSRLGVLINGGSGIVSRDILKDISKPITNTDYFDIVITDLKPSTSYNVQFAWVYPDDSRSDYSATYTFATSIESAPDIPSVPTVTAGPGLINVTWNGNRALGGSLTNYSKVNIYVDGVLKDFFLAAGTKSIPLAKGTYSITLRSASSTNVVSNATSPAVSVTVTSDSSDAASALSGLDNKITISASSIVNPTTKQLTAINTGGITVYSGSSSSTGARVVMNSLGIAGYNSLDQATFSIEASTGNAYFKGEIQSSSGAIGGWSIGATSLSSNYLELVSDNPALGYGLIKFYSGAKTFNMVGTGGLWIVQDEANKNVITYGSSDLILGNSDRGIRAGLSHSYNNFGLRNIKSSTVDPVNATDGADGDVWLKYTP